VKGIWTNLLSKNW